MVKIWGSMVLWGSMSLAGMAADVKQEALQKIYLIPGIHKDHALYVPGLKMDLERAALRGEAAFPKSGAFTTTKPVNKQISLERESIIWGVELSSLPYREYWETEHMSYTKEPMKILPGSGMDKLVGLHLHLPDPEERVDRVRIRARWSW